MINKIVNLETYQYHKNYMRKLKLNQKVIIYLTLIKLIKKEIKV
jgi:hypothetical protein